jgi:peptide deformylase
MKLKIVQVGDPVLRQAAREMTAKEITSKEIQRLIADMRETMRDAPGVGLAAPQVGMSIQLAVIEDREEYLKEIAPEILAERDRQPVLFHAIINPKVTATSDAHAEFFEGCLSIGGLTAIVPRAPSVRVECINEKGEHKVIEASGWYARILQHEIDHLRGRLYVDRMHARTLTGLDNFSRFWKGKSIREIQAALEVREP